MSSWKTIGACAGSALFGALGLIAVHAAAEGAPTSQPLFYGGTVAGKDGEPLEGSHKVGVALFTGETGGTAICATPKLAVEFEAGRFRVELASGEQGCRAAVASNADTWVELSVDGTAFPRAKVGAVPYALEADHAKQASAVTGAQAEAITQLSTQVAQLQQQLTTLGSPKLKIRFISVGAGCDVNASTNSTVCACEPGELITSVGGYAGQNGIIAASRHQVAPDVANAPEADRARMWTMSCTTLTGTPRECSSVQAVCVKL